MPVSPTHSPPGDRDSPAAPAEAPALDVERVRADFPILREPVRGKPLVYLDNAATSQKPESVLQRLERFYRAENGNVHRAVHYLSEQATRAYEGARLRAARFLNAADAREIVFVRGTTEGINLVAHSFARPRLAPGDEVLVTAMEHHSNIVPWQMLCAEKGAVLRVAPVDDSGELLVEEYEALLGPRTRMVGLAHVSNALGTVNPVRELVALARSRGVPVLLDGAQAAPHRRVDVRELDCDFYVFSGHKLYAPAGIGVLYGKREHLESMPPWQGGGDMIRSVSFDEITYAPPPHRFEAGTPNAAGAVALAAAIDYVEGLGLERIAAHEGALVARAMELLSVVPEVRLLGSKGERAGIVSFLVGEIHPHDVAAVLDGEGIAVRAGHHCAEPLMQRLGVPGTVRASFAPYNTLEEVERLVEAVALAREVFA